MMGISKGYLFNYYGGELDLFLEQLDKIHLKPGKKEIHRFRVGIKKFRFFYYLLEQLFPALNARDLYKPFKFLFKTAGNLRTAQIIRSYLTHHNVHPGAVAEYLKYLEKQTKGFKRKFIKQAKAFDRHQLDTSTKRIKRLSAKTSASEIREAGLLFASAQLNRIKQLLALAEHPVIAHEIRKHLKVVHSVLSFLNAMKTDKTLDKPIDLAAQYGERLGEWHDQSVLVASVEQYLNRSENIPPGNLMQLIKLTDRIKRKDTVFLKTMRKDLAPDLEIMLKLTSA